jgi:hypothetical protein
VQYNEFALSRVKCVPEATYMVTVERTEME